MPFITHYSKILCLSTIALLWANSSIALTPLFDGDFESGTLQGWTPGNSGSAIIASRGTCFSDHDTTALSLRGRYAGLLRSGKNIKEGQGASLTSKSFIAGSGLVFLALSEQRDSTPKNHPFALNISILDAAGDVLQSKPFATALAQLNGGCPSLTSDASFSQHHINTQPYQGKQIKLRFSHHPDLAANGAFTLIDEVSIVQAQETPVFQSYPIAKAGFEFIDNNLLLTAQLPDGDVEQTRSWQFSWLINGERSRRAYYNPCINDLSPGDYTANLYVRQHNRVITDTLHFSVPYIIFSSVDVTPSDTSTTDTDSDEDDTIEEDDSAEEDNLIDSKACNFRHPLDQPKFIILDDEVDDTDTTS